MSRAFGAGHVRYPIDKGLARRARRGTLSASKVHPVAMVAEHVEDPVGLQRPRSCHEIKGNAGGLRHGAQLWPQSHSVSGSPGLFVPRA